jgi:hypothetical protein
MGIPYIVVWYIGDNFSMARVSAFFQMPSMYNPLSNMFLFLFIVNTYNLIFSEFHPQQKEILGVCGGGHAACLSYGSSEEEVTKKETEATTYHFAGVISIARELILWDIGSGDK